jgi:membrane glycosyltransferase
MSDRPKLYYHDHLGLIRGGEPADGFIDISPDTVVGLQNRIALLEAHVTTDNAAVIATLKARIEELEAAIRKHKDSFAIPDQTEEDLELWALLQGQGE